MNVHVKINVDMNVIGRARQERFDRTVLPALTMQVIKDSNHFCRQDQGTLIASSLTASKPTEGIVVWDTPYAKRMYYTGTPCLDVNPNASLMWFESAKRAKRVAWLALVKKGMK